MTGTISGRIQVDNEYVLMPISFGGKLRFSPTVELVDVAAPGTDNCPGSAGNPAAAPGYLCVYSAWEYGTDDNGFGGYWDALSGSTGCGCRRGVTIWARGDAGAEVSGTWVLRAPTGGAMASSPATVAKTNGSTGANRR